MIPTIHTPLGTLIPTTDAIPCIVDPMGQHWEQPDLTEVVMTDTHVTLTQAQFDGLAEYSTTNPSGVYVGKCWKSEEMVHTTQGYTRTGKWLLRWYGNSHKGSGYCSNNQREIIIAQPGTVSNE